MLGSTGVENNRITFARRSELDEVLNEVYFSCCPKLSDYQQRRTLIHRLKELAKGAYGNSRDSPVVEEFGSFVMDMFSPGSDLDLSINFNNNGLDLPRNKKIQALRKFAKKFKALQRKGHMAGVQVILGARVPIVKVTDSETGIECDLSVENRDGVTKSQIIYAISTIDERFRKLCILMKAWAKGHDINSSKDRTLNSLSLISLVAFHLQTRDPPILPPFVELLKDGTNPASVQKLVPNYLDCAKRNKESLGDLFFSLLTKLEGAEKLWSTGLCASPYLGSWISKTDSRIYFMNVEDFTDRSQNVARAVGFRGFKSIYDCVHNSLYHLLAFQNGEMQGSKLREFLFHMGTASTPSDRAIAYSDSNPTTGLSLSNSHLAKKRQLMDGREQKPGEEGEQGTEGWNDWVREKQTGLGGKRVVEEISGDRQPVDRGTGQAGGWGEKHQQLHSGRKRKQQTEVREDGESTGSGDKPKVETSRDRQPVDSEGAKRVKYNGSRSAAAAQFTSPVLHRPYQAPPMIAASEYGNRLHYVHNKPLLQTVPAHYLLPVVPYHQAPTAPIASHVQDNIYNTQFPPPVPYQTPPPVVFGKHGYGAARRFEGSHGPLPLPQHPFAYPHNHVAHPMPFPGQNQHIQINQYEYSGGLPYHYRDW